MSNFGVFAIIINEGKQDAMLEATDFLTNRLKLVRMERAKNPKIRDPTPTLRDVEETHILFVNAHFRPFVTFGYEYHKTSTNGAVNFGSTGVIFSIEQYGEFFNDMVVNVLISGLDASVPGVESTTTAYWVAWSEYVGLRLFRQVTFTVNGTILDQYGSDTQNMHSKFFVTPNKVPGWNRMVGQEEHEDLRVPPANYNYTGGKASVDYIRGGHDRVETITSGAQTSFFQQDPLDLWIPLLFWFNLDCRISFPSISVPYGQRFIMLDLAPLDTLLWAIGTNNNAPELQVIAAPDDAQISARVFAPITNIISSWTQAPVISQMNIFTNNIFVHKDIHEIYLKRVGFNMVRVHREQYFTVNTNNQTQQLQQMKWPIETVYCGLRPKTNLQHPDLWHRFYAVQNFSAATAGSTSLLTNAIQMVKGAAPQNALVPRIDKGTLTIDRITLSLQSVPIYTNMDQKFFNSYIPFTYGAQHINTPFIDRGVLMITFNLYPGAYQPSGYINISRAREFFLEYFSSVVGVVQTGSLLGGFNPTAQVNGDLALVQADLFVLGIAINFLLVSDGSAVLRYTT